MELNREHIIKALECCAKDDCDNCPNDFGNCYSNLAGYALSLIKELTEENERLRAENEILDILVKDLRGRNNGLQRANESLAKDCDILEDELNECVQIKADTVRKMQERLRECFDNEIEHKSIYTESQVLFVIDQIAKEMVEGEK